MDKLFDQLSRLVASPVPRRQVLRSIGSAVVAAALAPLGIGKPSQGPKPQPGSCKPRWVDCGDGRCCQPNHTCCVDLCCPPSHTCCSGKCCNPSQQCVDGNCVKGNISPSKP
jgi:hypothetical protein